MIVSTTLAIASCSLLTRALYFLLSLIIARHASEIAREQAAVNNKSLANEYMKYQKTWEEVMASETPPPAAKAPVEVLMAQIDPELKAAQDVRERGSRRKGWVPSFALVAQAPPNHSATGVVGRGYESVTSCDEPSCDRGVCDVMSLAVS